ncbi:radial spoke head 1 homolog [Teleopsis dalmanni]|uniref:radial spoke head 1 homolog n=1 Tax=Teleopsis dalmanni TaxID=139649 RepID=UPI000D32AFE9|nr:radial spoke head 1 homolog [Teleopsis dalmanni]XP_037946926.1 radial spoke head 1 homolog [Teleopsis dalmanni]
MTSNIAETDSYVTDYESPEIPNIGLYIGGRNAAGQRHGRGWAILPNGDQYDGFYRKGQRHGIGLYVFLNGARYYGNYRCGHRSGFGTFFYPDGSLYEGCWRKGVKHGKGRYTYPNGDSYYGEWINNEKHGVGIYKYDKVKCTPMCFKGTFQQNERLGPFELYIGSDDRKLIVHGNFSIDYPIGPTVLNYNHENMTVGFFQSPNYDEVQRSKLHPHAEGEAEDFGEELVLLPTEWNAQEICAYDYSQIPQDPIPLPRPDSDESSCSLTTKPSEEQLKESVECLIDMEEEEGGQECIPCEDMESCSITSALSSLNLRRRDPCNIDEFDMIDKDRPVTD